MTRKIKVFLSITLIIQFLIPAYLLSHHYSVMNTALESGTEYRFKITSIEFDYYTADDNEYEYICENIYFRIAEINALYNGKIAVSLDENGLPVLEVLKDKKQTDSWFDYDYYSQCCDISADKFTFSPDMNTREIIRRINSEYSWFNRNDEDKTYAYLSAKIYKGIFIPTAIYFNGIKVISITNER